MNGRFSLEAWLPGADVTNDPREIDVDAVLAPDTPTRISSLNDLEQHGWKAVQGEVLLLPIGATDLVRRILVLAGSVEREAEATLMVVCRSAGAVLDHLAERRGHDVRERLARRMATATSAFRPSVRAIVDEYLGAVEARGGPRGDDAPRSAARHALFGRRRDVDGRRRCPRLAPGAVELSTRRIAIGIALGNGATAVIELLASPARPFTVERADAALVGADVLSAWLAGIALGVSQAPAQGLPEAPAAPPFEDSMRAELARANRLSLSGGVVVASVPGAAVPDPRVLAAVIRTVRAGLRSADLLGQLAGGDIAAVLVRTSPEGVAKAAERIRAQAGCAGAGAAAAGGGRRARAVSGGGGGVARRAGRAGRGKKRGCCSARHGADRSLRGGGIVPVGEYAVGSRQWQSSRHA